MARAYDNLKSQRPWQSRQEFLVDEALTAAVSDPETIRSIRPVHPRVLFPETRGFLKQSLDLETVMSLDRYMATNRSWLSGMPVMRSSLTEDVQNGSSRYSMGSMWS
jgi:hypothetical protein